MNCSCHARWLQIWATSFTEWNSHGRWCLQSWESWSFYNNLKCVWNVKIKSTLLTLYWMTALSHYIFTCLRCLCSCALPFSRPMRKQQYSYFYRMTASAALEIWFKLLSTTLICWIDYIIWQWGIHQRDTVSSMIQFLFGFSLVPAFLHLEWQIPPVHNVPQHISSQHYFVRFCKQIKNHRNKSSIPGMNSTLPLIIEALINQLKSNYWMQIGPKSSSSSKS